MVKSSVKASDINTSVIIGTFDGECADSNITNKNGLDITHEVWENVFSSEEYAEGIEHGWFLGYLGHPDDPGAQTFQDACIIMREGHLDDNGKIYGKFDLVDTPVGRVVKTFIDAGVKFGISVRGAGDIYNNSVDPDTFVFRGFDLVAFPAYPESVPEFTAIAASTDIEVQKKYKAVCAAVRTNLESITSAETLDIMQSQFAKQSEEYQMIEDRKNEIYGTSKDSDTDCVDSTDEISSNDSDEIDIQAQRIDGMTELYLRTREDLVNANARIKELEKINASIIKDSDEMRNHIKILESTSLRKQKSFERIIASQMEDLKDELHDSESKCAKAEMKCRQVVSANAKLKSESIKLHDENKKLITANTKLMTEKNNLSKSNLIYKQRIEATANDIDEKDSVISDLRSELRETVTAATETEEKTSNLDAMVRKLEQEVSAATKLIHEYQDAYANIYANAIGVRLEDVRVTSATSVKELQSIISSSQITTNSSAIQESDIADIEFVSEADDSDDLVTL